MKFNLASNYLPEEINVTVVWISPPYELSAECDINVMGFRLCEKKDNSDSDGEDDEEPLQEQEASPAGEFWHWMYNAMYVVF